MNIPRVAITIGAGITSFLLVAVLVIELIDVEFSAIIGLPLGVLAGIAVSLWLWGRIDRFRQPIRRGVAAYATFGSTVLALLGFRYANIGRSVLTLEVVVGGSLAAAGVVYAALVLFHQEQPA